MMGLPHGAIEAGFYVREAMEAAEINFKTAKAWGDTLKAAVACLI
jgi:hypothetical protein